MHAVCNALRARASLAGLTRIAPAITMEERSESSGSSGPAALANQRRSRSSSVSGSSDNVATMEDDVGGRQPLQREFDGRVARSQLPHERSQGMIRSNFFDRPACPHDEQARAVTTADEHRQQIECGRLPSADPPGRESRALARLPRHPSSERPTCLPAHAASAGDSDRAPVAVALPAPSPRGGRAVATATTARASA